MLDPQTESLLAQFAALQAPADTPEIKPLPVPPEQVRTLLGPTEYEHQSEAI